MSKKFTLVFNESLTLQLAKSTVTNEEIFLILITQEEKDTNKKNKTK